MTKKLLYQLDNDLRCSLQGFFSQRDCDAFDHEVGKGKGLLDSDGREVVRFEPPSTIIVCRGYRWDGCSPKLNVLDLFWIGTPDGCIIGSERPRDRKDEPTDIPISQERITHIASAVHDVLGYCKYDNAMPALFRAPPKPQRDLWFTDGRRNRDRLFLELLKLKKHRLRWVYYTFVCLLGPLYDLVSGVESTS